MNSLPMRLQGIQVSISTSPAATDDRAAMTAARTAMTGR